ncbi:MAG: energy-dependent translational throttle protein EttA [Algisphaera sp.]
MAENSERIIYSMVGVTKRYDKNVVLNGVNLSYFYGAKIGVLGTNGAGKSSLLRILAGVDKEYEGEVQLQPGFRIGYLPQEPKMDPDMTVMETVREAVKPVTDLLEEFDRINDQFGEEMSDDDMTKLIERQGEVQEKLEHLGAWEIDSKLEMAMDALRCPPGDAKMGPLSGGEQRRVALCRLLLEKPDVLLLDEPTNHLDAESVGWLERHLQQYEGTVIAITHDRYFLDNVATWILELEFGVGHPFKGNYSEWLGNKAKRMAVDNKKDENRQKSLKRELDWMGKSPAGRQAKSKARVKRYEELASKAGREKAKTVQIYLAPGPRLGDKVLEVRNLTKGYDSQLLFDDVSFDLPPGGIVGVVGPNGAGKTTLFRMITGKEQPDSGTLTLGDTVKLAYVEQMRESLSDDDTVWQSITGGKDFIKLGGQEINSRAYVARFNFSGTDQQQKVGSLSGGQRNRVNLARMLTTEFNVLLLDEPTNDLDVNTVRALEEALEDFPGCAVVISHDRWFLDRMATHILAFEGDSKVRFFEGNYQAYAAKRREELGVDADQPHRIKYRKLTR